MEEKTVKAPNISCGHCTATIEREISEVEGVEKVRADKDTKEVSIRWNPPATWEKIAATLAEIGYPAAG